MVLGGFDLDSVYTNLCVAVKLFVHDVFIVSYNLILIQQLSAEYDTKSRINI